MKAGEASRWPIWLQEWLAEHPFLAGATARWLEAAELVRQAAAEAFVDPLEPVHPHQGVLEEGLTQLAQAAATLEDQPSRQAAREALRRLAALTSESYFLAPTRATSSGVARAAVAQAVKLAQKAWQELQEQASVRQERVPWRLALATHVPVEVPWEEARVAGNAVAGLPVADWPWGERCSLTGRWWQEDGTGACRHRNLETLGMALSLQAWEVFASLRQAFTRFQKADPEGAAELLAAFPELADEFTPEIASNTFAALGLTSPPSLAVALNNALRQFANRPLFANLPQRRWLTYQEVRQESLALCKALVATGPAPGGTIAIALSQPCLEAYLVDFACVFAGLTSVGLDPAWSTEHTLAVLERVGAQALVGDPQQLSRLNAFPGRKLPVPVGCALGLDGGTDRLPAGYRAPTGVGLDTPVVLAEHWPERAAQLGLVADPEGSLYTVVFTSGSTGEPKGVPITRQRMRCQDFQAFLWPLIIPSYQPFALFADRRAVWQAVMNGGRVGFCRPGAELWQDLQALAPTYLEGPPALFQPLVAAYRHALAEGQAPRALANLRLRLRQRLGGRVAACSVGGAPVPEDLPSLLQTLLQAPVQEAYGTTELGTIAQGGRLRPGVKVRLVDRPELGLTQKDTPYPRGELAVQLDSTTAQGLGLPPSDPRLTAEGFFLTGDLVELQPDGRLKVLGRTGDAVKLADGRFMLPAAAEAALLATGLVERVALLAGEGQTFLVVVPVAETDGSNLRERLAAAWNRAFPGRPCPPILVDAERTAWTADNGLATASGKPRRAALARFYLPRLSPSPSSHPVAPQEPPSVLLFLAQVLGTTPDQLDRSRPLAEQGLDSLATAEVLALADARGVQLYPEDLRQRSLEQLLRLLGEASPAPPVPLPPQTRPVLEPVRRSLEEELQLAVLRLPLPKAKPPFAPRGLTLLTGATGFVGVHLLAELAADPPAGGPVVALVRAKDGAHARARLTEALRRAGLPSPSLGSWGDPTAAVWAVAGQLHQPQLGLAEQLYQRMAQEVAVIVHAAASVRHLATFAELRQDNVETTTQLLRFATCQRLKAFHLVSTLDVTRLVHALGLESREEAPLPPRLPEEAVHAGGYVLSKWVAERQVELLWQHLQGTWPVVVSRPGLVSWSSHSGFANLNEWFPALFASCLQLGVVPTRAGAGFPAQPVLTETSARGLQPLPVDFLAQVLARLTAALCTAAQQGKASFLRLNLLNTNPGTAGLVLWPQLFAGLQAACLATGCCPLRAVRWSDFRDLALAQETPFAALAAVFAELPALPRFPAATLQSLLSPSTPPPWTWQRFIPFLRWWQRAQQEQTR
ncbi:MAG: AMP-binding protein [Thermoanaerobaculum sp.]|nr:AMP-binding protein [Thermoanaerobaculum sp.]